MNEVRSAAVIKKDLEAARIREHRIGVEYREHLRAWESRVLELGGYPDTLSLTRELQEAEERERKEREAQAPTESTSQKGRKP